MKVSVKDRRLVMCLFFSLLTFVLAIDYRVDSSGGPLTLEEDIEIAFEKWMDIETELQANITEDANTLIKYGNQDLLGPDVVSLSISKLEGGEREVTVLFNANSDLLTFAILNETGSLAGLEVGEQGAMNPKLSSSSPSEPTGFDRQALTSLAQFAPEDINRDGVVDFYDLFDLSKAFGPQGINSSADINQDGEVDSEDVRLIELAYTFSAPARTPRGQSPTEGNNENEGKDAEAEEEEIEETLEDPQSDEVVGELSSETKQGEGSEEAEVSESSQEESSSEIEGEGSQIEVLIDSPESGAGEEVPEEDPEKNEVPEGSQNEGAVGKEESPAETETEGEGSQAEVLIDSPENESDEEVPEEDSEKNEVPEGSQNEEGVEKEELPAEIEGEDPETEALVDSPGNETDEEVREGEENP